MVDIAKYNELKTKAIMVSTSARTHLNSARDLKARYDESSTQLEENKKSVIVQSVSIDTLKELVDKLSQQYIEKIVNLLTYALSTIFYDKKYSVEISTAEQRSQKTAEMFLVEELDDGSILKSSFSDAIGGGILSVCGLVLQVYFCNVLGQAPVLFLDEQLSQVSAEYTENLMMFIKELSESKDFIMILVTHDERYKQYADKTYHVSDGVYTEVKVGAKNV